MRAWTGKGMALPLSRKLGLSKTWQLMQALGEMPNSGIQTVDSPFYLPGNVKLTSSVLSSPIGNRATSVSKLWKPPSQGSERLVVVRGSEGGRVWRKTASSSRTIQATGRTVPLQDCPAVGSGGGGASLCNITTNECVDTGASVTGRCAIPTLGAAGACIGGAAAAGLITLGSGGVLGGVAIAGSAAGCAAAGGAAATCCREYATVQVYCRR